MSEKNNIITTLKLKQNGKNKITTRKRFMYRTKEI